MKSSEIFYWYHPPFVCQNFLNQMKIRISTSEIGYLHSMNVCRRLCQGIMLSLAFIPLMNIANGSFHTKISKKIQTLLDFHEIWHRHGLYKETFSHQNLADSIDLPLRYDHLNFILKYHFSYICLIKWPYLCQWLS